LSYNFGSMSGSVQAGVPLELRDPAIPTWVDELFVDLPTETRFVQRSLVPLYIRQNSRFQHVHLALPGAREMDILTLQHSVSTAYRAILEHAHETQYFPARFWAFIPRIHADYGTGLDRYMAFNAGRFAAYLDHFGDAELFSRLVATASAVGSQAHVLEIQCLASRSPGLPVENPRQIPAYRYSSRFGPLPPCFSRATLLPQEDRRALLLVGGTASILGEETVHTGELAPQILETFANMATVVGSAFGGVLSAREDLTAAATASLLQSFRDLRVYYRDAEHRGEILEIVGRTFGGQCRVEIVRAELCRRELLVEIEGVAEALVDEDRRAP
jgi:chorismate lyase / 3-hydroxybenzoate synthase